MKKSFQQIQNKKKFLKNLLVKVWKEFQQTDNLIISFITIKLKMTQKIIRFKGPLSL